MSRNGSSLAPNSRIPLSALLRARDSTIIPPGAFIQVKVLWRSGLQNDAKACNLILSDDNNHISAVVFSIDVDNNNARNVCEKLKPSTSWRIFKFEVLTAEVEWSLLQHQNKQLKLSSSTLEIRPIPLGEGGLPAPTFVNYIPFMFVRFEDIDLVPDNNWIDLIGFAESFETKTSQNGNQYKLLRVRPFKADGGIKKDIAIFGEWRMNSVKRKNAVYAFLNVEVTTFNNQKSLKAKAKTAIFEVKSTDVENILPAQYHEGEFVRKLFPRRRSSLRAQIPAPVPSAGSILQSALNNTL